MYSKFGLEFDEKMMQEALVSADEARSHNEVPIGALVVDSSGDIIGRAFNKVESMHSQAYHAEVTALSEAGKARNTWRLEGCWLYVTLEPCSMCMALARLSRIEGIVFGATSPIFGYRLDNTVGYQLYKDDTIVIIEGIRSKESADLLRAFFKERRILSE